MLDPNRLNRVHVVDVKCIENKYYVFLSDNTKVLWDHWITYDRKERWGY
jgi:hypothetical protein